MRVIINKLRFWFLDTFGERTIERSIPAHGNWEEICGWDFNGKFYPINKGQK